MHCMVDESSVIHDKCSQIIKDVCRIHDSCIVFRTWKVMESETI